MLVKPMASLKKKKQPYKKFARKKTKAYTISSNKVDTRDFSSYKKII